MREMEWKETFRKLLRGVGAAALCTLPGMALLAAAMVFTPMEDTTLVVCNQLLKCLSIFAGAYAAVGRGGSRGFVTGAAVALGYVLLGFGAYCALEGSAGALGLLGGEALFGTAVGALSGAVCANMRPARKKPARA